MRGCIRCCDRGEVDIIGPSEGLVASSILAGRTTLPSPPAGPCLTGQVTGQASDGFIASLCLTASRAGFWLNLGLKGTPPSENDERLLDRSNSRFAF